MRPVMRDTRPYGFSRRVTTRPWIMYRPTLAFRVPRLTPEDVASLVAMLEAEGI